jgi:hypothetical protein
MVPFSSAPDLFESLAYSAPASQNKRAMIERVRWHDQTTGNPRPKCFASNHQVFSFADLSAAGYCAFDRA